MTDDPDVRRAVIDRIVDGQAVLLVHPDEHEHHLPADRLPAGAGEGAWLLVAGSGPDLHVVDRDARGESERRAAAEKRLGRLRRTRRGGRFDDRP